VVVLLVLEVLLVVLAEVCRPKTSIYQLIHRRRLNRGRTTQFRLWTVLRVQSVGPRLLDEVLLLLMLLLGMLHWVFGSRRTGIINVCLLVHLWFLLDEWLIKLTY
jgi:hypothetical protein